MSSELTTYRVWARNSATESENRIHDDAIAARFGFRGGLVPGITVYGYMTVPVVDHFGREWLERGATQVKFIQPAYAGDERFVRTVIATTSAAAPSTNLRFVNLTITS